MSCSSVEPAPSADSIEGSATLTFDRSRIVIPATATQTQNARHRCGEVSAISVVGGCAPAFARCAASSWGWSPTFSPGYRRGGCRGRATAIRASAARSRMRLASTDERHRVLHARGCDARRRDRRRYGSRHHAIGRRRAAAPTYVLIHGIGMGRTIFADLVEHLRAGANRVRLSRSTCRDTAKRPSRRGSSRWSAPPTSSPPTCAAAGISGRRRHRALDGHPGGGGGRGAASGSVEDASSSSRPTVNPRERTAAQQVLRLAQDLAVESPRVIFVGAREYLRAGPHLRAKFRAMLVHRPEGDLSTRARPGARAAR